MIHDKAVKIAEKINELIDIQNSTRVLFNQNFDPLMKLISAINVKPVISFEIDDWEFLDELNNLVNDKRNENIWIIFNRDKYLYDIYLFSNDDVLKLGSPCPYCKYRLDLDDLTINCNKCGHINEHHNIMLNCDNCKTELEIFECPNCHEKFALINLIGSFSYKIKDIQVSNFPPLEIAEVTSYFRYLNGEEVFNFQSDKKPVSIIMYALEDNYPDHSTAKGFLLPIDIPTWESELASGRYSDIGAYLEEYMIGTIKIEHGGSINGIKLIAEPRNL